MTSATDVVRGLDPAVPIHRMMPMQARVDDSLVRRRFVMVLLSLFAGVALVLAVVGIGGVMAYVVTQGTRDIGIRLALGATPGNVLALVMQQGALVAAIGVGLGLGAALFATRLVDGLLFGVPRTDILTYASTAACLLLVALLAVFIPAVRASRIDPLISLRHE